MSMPKKRYLIADPPSYLKRPAARLQPLLAKDGETNIDLEALAADTKGIAEILPAIAIKSPEHWKKTLEGLGDDIDGIIPVSITAYPTEIWNSHPEPLIKRGLPFIFWPIIKYNEPDFWRWSARDFLSSLGVETYLVKNKAHGIALLKSLAMRRFISQSSMVVFGKQNFPWNVPAAGHLLTETLGIDLRVKSLDAFRKEYNNVSDKDADAVWRLRKGERYEEKGVKKKELRKAIRTYRGIKKVLEKEKAVGFGVNCFGDLVIDGGRDVPCFAQTLLREEGYIASCDGDYLAMMSMVLATYFTDQTAMMSNMYPVEYEGALKDHFGDSLSPSKKKYRKKNYKNMARLGHCGFIGVVSPEMTSKGTAYLQDWGGTYEIKRDGSGCGIDADMKKGAITAVQVKFDGKTLLIARGEVLETTKHKKMPHCEITALLRFDDLRGFVENISREHSVIVHGDHAEDFATLGEVLGMKVMVF